MTKTHQDCTTCGFPLIDHDVTDDHDGCLWQPVYLDADGNEIDPWHDARVSYRGPLVLHYERADGIRICADGARASTAG